MKKIIAIFILLILTCSCSIINNVTNDDIIKYLNSKYGNQGFFFVEESTCDMFEVGHCSYVFSEPSLDGETFIVTWEDSKGKTMKDNYIDKLYRKQLSEYYSKYFADKLNIPYSIDVILDEKCDECNQGFIIYEEYFRLVQDKKLWIRINVNDSFIGNSYFHLKTSDNNVDSDQLGKARTEVKKYVENKYNLNGISKTVSEIINSNNLNNINRVYFYIYGCMSDEYTVSCSYTNDLYKK